jgi:hypothetical protein
VKRFTIYEDATPIGEAVRFSDGIVVVRPVTGLEYFVTLGEMLERHPTWGIEWVDA